MYCHSSEVRRMRAIAVGCLALSLIVTGSAAAQRGMGGIGGMGRGGMGGGRRGGGGGAPMREEEVKFPSASDLQKFNPAALIVDKRKKVSLDDAQVTALTAIRGRIYERNADVLARYDSIRKDFKPPKVQDRDRTGSTPETDSVRLASLNQMQTLRQLLDTLSARRTNDVREVLDFLTDEKQHKAAVELLNDQDRDFTDKLPRMAQGRGGRRGRGEP
jgi:hypothetical protein